MDVFDIQKQRVLVARFVLEVVCLFSCLVVCIWLRA